MDYQTLAKEILKNVGGAENVISAQHCATRLRIVTKNQNKVAASVIENLDKVKGSFYHSGQYQIILGTGVVDKVYEAFAPLIGFTTATASEIELSISEKMTMKRAVRIFGDVFVPIIPVLVATGLFMGLRGLLTQEAILGFLGMTPNEVPQQLIQFTQILTDTAFAFLPALVAWSTFNIFGGARVHAAVRGYTGATRATRWPTTQGPLGYGRWHVPWLPTSQAASPRSPSGRSHNDPWYSAAPSLCCP